MTKRTQTMEMKQNKTFFHGTYSNITPFFIGPKYYYISITFIIDMFQFHCKRENK